MADKKARNGKIDLFKFIMSLIVITYHFKNVVNYENEWFTMGYIAVEFFFIVSGYLFAKSLKKLEDTESRLVVNSSLTFMKNKYIGFLPYHIFTCVATFIYMAIKEGWLFADWIENIINGLPDILIIQMGGMKRVPLLGHEWYISAMLIVMFILTPIMIKYRKQYSCYIAPVLSLLLYGYLLNTYENINIVTKFNGYMYAGVLRALADISLGIVCFAISESGFVEKRKKAPLFITEILCYTIAIIYAFGKYTSTLEFSVTLIIATGVTISFSEKASLKFLNNKFVYFLGKLSFPIYLVQLVVRQLIGPMDWEYGYLSHLGVFVAATIGAALLCMIISDSAVKLIHRVKGKKSTGKSKNQKA